MVSLSTFLVIGSTSSLTYNVSSLLSQLPPILWELTPLHFVLKFQATTEDYTHLFLEHYDYCCDRQAIAIACLLSAMHIRPSSVNCVWRKLIRDTDLQGVSHCIHRQQAAGRRQYWTIFYSSISTSTFYTIADLLVAGGRTCEDCYYSDGRLPVLRWRYACKEVCWHLCGNGRHNMVFTGNQKLHRISMLAINQSDSQA